MIISSTFFESLTIASAVPFLKVISSPESLYQEKFFQNLNSFLGFTNPSELILPIVIMFALSVIVSSVIRIYNIWAGAKLSAEIGTDLSSKVYTNKLYQPYIEHINSNSSSLIATNATQITVVVDIITSAIRFLSSSLVVISIFILISLFDFVSTISAVLIFLFCYLSIISRSRKKLDKNSKIFEKETKNQIKIIQEGLGSIRDIIINSDQKAYQNIFEKTDFNIRKSQANVNFLLLYPKYFIEGISLVFISLLALILNYKFARVDIIPTIGTLAFSAQKLLPAMQQTYGNWAYIRGSKAAMINVLNLLSQSSTFVDRKKYKPLNFSNLIEFKNLKFKYPSSKKLIINNLNLSFKKGERIGFVGSTGCGKSTLMDIFMGLLDLSEGSFLIDGKVINSKKSLIKSWMCLISHVPQNVFLIDGTFLENITLCSSQNKINYEKVRESAKIAQIDSFIMGQEDQYDSNVGEKGLKISGGQRQRIGIARALYKNSEILVFDEATSALDTKTEKEVMESIFQISRKKTILIVAHRLSTLEKCDRIIKFSKEGIVEEK